MLYIYKYDLHDIVYLFYTSCLSSSYDSVVSDHTAKGTISLGAAPGSCSLWGQHQESLPLEESLQMTFSVWNGPLGEALEG